MSLSKGIIIEIKNAAACPEFLVPSIYLLEIFELLVLRQTFLLGHSTVNCDGGEVLVGQERGQSLASLHRLHENDDLVELEHVEELEEFFVLLVLLQLDVVLLQAVQGELCLVVDVNFHGLKENEGWKRKRKAN